MNCAHWIVAYHEEFRTALFVSGFTSGAFLFSMKAMIVKTMREDCYDTDKHQEAIKERREMGENIGYYQSLLNFSRLLIAAIAMSFLSALLQITLGYTTSLIAVVICLISAGASWMLIGASFVLVAWNWERALEYAESKAVENNEKQGGR